MKQTIQIFTFVSFLFASSTLVAQLDKSNGTNDKGKIKAFVLNNNKVAEQPTSITLNGTDGFKKAFDEEQEKLKEQQAEKAFENKGIITKELARKIKFQKFIEKNTLQIPMIDKDIGVFRTKSKNIYLNAFDYGEIDGDKITILKNGKPFLNEFFLFSQPKTKTIVIPLNEGFNLIEILAVHEGTLRPNTGAFTLFDDEKKEVFSDLWQLAKGAKVIAHIIREKK